MILSIVITLYAAVIVFDYLPGRSADPRGLKALYLALTAVSFAVMVLAGLGVQVPSPADPITAAVRAIFGPK